MLSARGRYILFADGDGATTFEDVERLEIELQRLVRSEMVCKSCTALLYCNTLSHLLICSVLNYTLTYIRVYSISAVSCTNNLYGFLLSLNILHYKKKLRVVAIPTFICKYMDEILTRLRFSIHEWINILSHVYILSFIFIK